MRERDYTMCSRGLRFLLTEKQRYDELEKYADTFKNAYHAVSQFVWDNLSSLKSFNAKYKFKDDINTNDLNIFWTDKQKKHFLQAGVLNSTRQMIKDAGITASQRYVVRAVLASYDSFKKRNRNIKNKEWPMKPLQWKINNGVRFDDSVISDKNGCLTFPSINNQEHHPFKYINPGTQSKIKEKYFHPKGNFGGTLVKEGGIWKFTALYRKPLNFDKSYKDWCGTDFNKGDNGSLEHFVYLVPPHEPNNTTIISKPQEVDDIEKEIAQVNNILRDKSTTGGKRRYHNNLRIKLHKQHKKLIRPIIQQIMKFVRTNNYSLAIDNVKTGQTSGSWGQDKLINALTTECENINHRFYVNNPYNSSRKCPKCQYVAKKNRKNVTQFECEECGFTENAHIVGALNCAFAAYDAFPCLTASESVV